MAASGLTIFHCVPTLLRAVIAGLPGGVHVPSLRILNMGGETVSRADLQVCWDRLNPGVRHRELVWDDRDKVDLALLR